MHHIRTSQTAACLLKGAIWGLQFQRPNGADIVLRDIDSAYSSAPVGRGRGTCADLFVDDNGAVLDVVRDGRWSHAMAALVAQVRSPGRGATPSALSRVLGSFPASQSLPSAVRPHRRGGRPTSSGRPARSSSGPGRAVCRRATLRRPADRRQRVMRGSASSRRCALMHWSRMISVACGSVFSLAAMIAA